MRTRIVFFVIVFMLAYGAEAQSTFASMSRSERKQEVKQLLQVDVADMSLTTDQVMMYKKRMEEAGNYLVKQDMKMMYWGWGSAIGGTLVFPILFIAIIDAPVVAGVLMGTCLIGGMTVGSIPMFRNNHGQELLDKSRLMLVDANSQPIQLQLAEGRQLGIGLSPVAVATQVGSVALCPTLTLRF